MKLDDLKTPFAYNDIEWRAGATTADKTKALALAYITSRAVMNRLDDVCGAHNWRDEYAPGPSGGVICGISIKIGDEWITKWDGAENSDIEGVKGGLSDAFKRAGVKWGIGRYLYDLDGTWVQCEQRGKTVVLSEKPKLPNWALPAGSQKPPRPTAQVLRDLGEDPAPPKTNGQRSIAPAVITKIIEGGYADNKPNAIAMLKLSTIMGDEPEATILKWCKIYRAQRDTGRTTGEAADFANNQALA